MDMQMKKAVKETRPRNPAATRADLLEAARILFSHHGYEMVGLRQIAAEVDVNQALVNRYFGSKLGLFTEALEGIFPPDRWFEGDRKTIGWRVAAWIASLQRSPQEGVDALPLLIKSCSHPEANDALRKAFDTQAIEPLAAWLGGARAVERAGVLTGLMTGVNLLGQVVQSSAFAGSDPEAIIASLGPAMQCVIDDVAQENPAGKTLHDPARRDDSFRPLTRFGTEQHEADAIDAGAKTVALIRQYETRIAALERLVGKQALELDFLKAALRSAP
jgi:AcrR family transcriptional regulator